MPITYLLASTDVGVKGGEGGKKEGWKVAENKSRIVEGWHVDRGYNRHLEGCRETGTGIQTKTWKWMFTALFNNSQRVGTQGPSANE